MAGASLVLSSVIKGLKEEVERGLMGSRIKSAEQNREEEQS